MSTIENPGSFNEWSKSHSKGLDYEYSVALQKYREQLAAERGITLAQLHDNFVTPAEECIGSLVVAAEAEVAVA